MFRRMVILSMILFISLSGCSSKSSQIGDRYLGTTSDWKFIYEEVIEPKGENFTIYEKLTATYIGTEEQLPQESFNIILKSEYTEMWFSENINFTQTDQREFELSGSITISTQPKEPLIHISIVTGSSNESIRLLKV